MRHLAVYLLTAVSVGVSLGVQQWVTVGDNGSPRFLFSEKQVLDADATHPLFHNEGHNHPDYADNSKEFKQKDRLRSVVATLKAIIGGLQKFRVRKNRSY